jgi:hypothetical protein
MKVLSTYKITFLTIGLMLLGWNIIAQDRTIYMGPGYITISAKAKANANAYRWLLDGVEQSEYSNKFSNTWKEGTFTIQVAPISDSCEGEWYTIALKVDSDVTIFPGGQIKFDNSASEACAVTNVVPSTGEVTIPISFFNDVLNPGESFTIKYKIDDLPIASSGLYKASNGAFTINILDLDPGVHKIKIMRLMYGTGFKNQKDYSNSKTIPTMLFTIRPKYNLGEINY